MSATRPTGALRGAARALALLAASLPAASCSGEAPPPSVRAKSVVLFTVDTLRADHVGAAGFALRPTPSMDRLAAESAWFTAAYSQATLTNSALTTILTGVFPFQHGVHTQAEVPNGVVPVQALAQEHGIATGSFIANMCKMQEVPGTVYSMGWDRSFCGMFLEEGHEKEQWEWDVAVVDAAIEWMAQQDGAFFCWIHLMDPHAEHRPDPELWDYASRPPREKYAQYEYFGSVEERREMPPPDELENLLEMYATEVQSADFQLGRVLSFLDSRADGDEVALVFSADHGEELFETWSRYDHGLSLTEGVLRVPLMVRARGVEPVRFDDPVETLQIAPTVAGLLALDSPVEYAGPSLLSDSPSRGNAASFATSDVITVRSRDLRYWWRNVRSQIQRPDDAAPWRLDAFWFHEPEAAARYAVQPTGYPVERLTDAEVGRRPAVDRLRKVALSYSRDAANYRPGRRTDDPAVLEFLSKLGYHDSEK
ncbi:MAG: sulfatase [Planctomycetota bacterium]